MNRLLRVLSLLVLGTFKIVHPRSFKFSGKNYFSIGNLLLHGGGRMSLGAGNLFQRGYDFDVKGGSLEIGRNNYFNKNVKIVCFDRVRIGNDCLIADSVHFYDHDHRCDDLSKPIKEQGYRAKPIVVGDNVWIGAKAVILKGVHLGNGSIVGAGSVVTADVAPNAIVGGVPARLLKTREEVALRNERLHHANGNGAPRRAAKP